MITYPVRWIIGSVLGLPVVALLCTLMYQGERGEVQRDLERRTMAALSRADVDWARATFDGMTARLQGQAYSESDRRRALDVVSRTWGVWNVTDATTLIPEASNYIWRAALERDHIHLSGYVPDNRFRRQIITAAQERFPGRNVEDEMQPARGAPGRSVWFDGVSFGLQQLTQLKRGGRVDLQGTGLAVSGEAASVLAYRNIKGNFSRRLPNGIRLAKDEVSPPRVVPFTWQIIAKANQLEFSGHVPGGKARAQVMAIAKNAFPRSAIVDKMATASGEPEAWLTLVGVIVRALSKLESGKAGMTDLAVTVSGLAVKEATALKVGEDLVKGIPKDFRLVHKIDFREPTLPTVSPFTTNIVSDGTSVSISGFAPSETARQRIIGGLATLFSKRKVIDALTIARGASAGWLTCVTAGAEAVARLESGRAAIRDELLQLSGKTRDEKVAAALPAQVRAAANRACKETISITVTAPPEPKLKWQAANTGKQLVLSGAVIDSKLQAKLVALAKQRMPNAEIVDKMRVSPGRSEKWPRVAQMGIELLSRLREGTARIDGQVLTVEGIAPDTSVATDLKNRLRNSMAPGYQGLASLEVKSDAMIWAEREAKRKSAEADRALKRKQAAEKRERSLAEIQRRAAEAAEAARRRQEALRRKAEEARRKAEEAARQEAARREAARAEEERLAREREALRRRQVAQRCQEELNRTAENGTVGFETGSDKLTRESEQTLDTLIAVWRGCPDARIEIGGHTDSVGSEERNLDLSQRRAQAVADYFVARGVPGDSLVARGYGEARPRVPNTSARNRARNRRIEFNVILN